MAQLNADVSAKAKSKAVKAASRYLNRELSWIKFNERVLAEAEDAENPLLERLRFLSIFESNFDEFFMVRVSGLREQLDSGIHEVSPDGLNTEEQIKLIYETSLPLRRRATKLLDTQLRPALAKAGIRIISSTKLSEDASSRLREQFKREIFPVCTPLILHPSPTLPFISNRSLNFAVELAEGSETKLARVKIPNVLNRFIRVSSSSYEFVTLEDVLANNLNDLFPGVEIKGAYLFRVIRDADVEIRELEAADLIATVEETLRLRRFGDPVLLEVSKSMPKRIRTLLVRLLELKATDVFSIDGMLGLDGLAELSALDLPGLRFPQFTSFLPEYLSTAKAIFETVSAHDVFLHHPFDSFRSVEALVRSAAEDPNVIGIKQTLYRVGPKSPIVESLLEAANAGKQVAVMVELKARFDEGNNLTWSRALERAGVHVSYGFPELKTHCKLCMIVRREPFGIRTYAHIGTGNYNPETARLYTDFGFMTSDPETTQDCLELFNYLTGFSRQTMFRKILVAPINLREGILDRIESEIKSHRKSGGGSIIFKLNSLVDPEIIDALYKANMEGVQIDLIVRGICCLKPGVGGMSENIRVKSIIGRFLEHSRVYYFENGGSPEALIGSADLMRRNLDRRIEVLVPVNGAEMVRHIRQDILQPYLDDSQGTWDLGPTGEYAKRKSSKSKSATEAQMHFLGHPSGTLRFWG